MSTSTTETGAVAPEVRQFLAAVRDRLADLDPDEQREILDGLEADLADLVAERGGGALGDPVAYARELRSAAGLEPEAGGARRRMSLADGVHAFLDDVHGRWTRLVSALPGDAPGLLDALRPVWWVLRGWVAVQTLAWWLGDWSFTVVPGEDLRGLAAVLVGVALSIQLGRGRLWPADGWRRIAGLRALLVGLNLFAVLMAAVVLNGLDHGRSAASSRAWDRGYRAGVQDEAARSGSVTDKAGLYADGKWVSQVYPYDAQGRPLVGVQLFNQIGQPINVITQPEYDDRTADGSLDGRARVYYPWTNGATPLFNVFPIPSRLQDDEQPSPTAFADAVRPAVDPFPRASVPPVSLPGIRTGRVPVPVSPSAAAAPTPGG
jgi:hypothetical protein